MKKYAILLAGAIRTNDELYRYANNLGFAYDVLKNQYSFDNIDMLYYKGYPFNYINNANISNNKATKINLINSFKKAQEALSGDDLLFFLVSNHGAADEHDAYICLFRDTNLSDSDEESAESDKKIYLSEIALFLNSIPCKKVIVLGECYSGNIAIHNICNAICLSACEKNACSFSSNYSPKIHVNNVKKKYTYDEFLLHFLSALNGTYPNGKTLNLAGNDYPLKPSNSILNAFKYAKAADTTIEMPQMISHTVKDILL